MRPPDIVTLRVVCPFSFARRVPAAIDIGGAGPDVEAGDARKPCLGKQENSPALADAQQNKRCPEKPLTQSKRRCFHVSRPGQLSEHEHKAEKSAQLRHSRFCQRTCEQALHSDLKAEISLVGHFPYLSEAGERQGA